MDSEKMLEKEFAKKRMMGNIILIIIAFIWGSAIIAQSIGMDYVGPFTFITMRSVIGGACMVSSILIINKLSGHAPVKHLHDKASLLLLGGVLCGVALFGGMAMQQIGLMKTSIANTGFISTLYIVIVPLLGLFMHKKVGMNIWIGIVLALCGLSLLCLQENMSIAQGDLYVFASAICYSFHIMIIDYFSTKVDCIKMSCIQFFVCAFLASIFMFIKEQPTISAILSAWAPLLYVGVLSTAVGYTLQMIAQKYTSPSVASLLLSMESVFAVFMGWLVLGETLSLKEFSGCALVFISVLVAQLPSKKSSKKKSEFIAEIDDDLIIEPDEQ